MRGIFKCGIIHGVIFYQMVSPEVFASEMHFELKNDIKAQVVDLSGSKDAHSDLLNIQETAQNRIYGLSLVPSKKVAKNGNFFENFTENAQKLEVLFIDEDLLNIEKLDLSDINTDIYLTLSTKTEPRDYEARFYKYAVLGISGINFDIETVTKGHLALCDKFDLKKCAHSIEFDRHLEQARKLDLDIAIL